MEFRINDINILTARKISREKAIELKIVLFDENDYEVYVLACNKNKKMIDEIKFILGKDIKIFIKDEILILDYIDLIYQGLENDVEETIIINAINNHGSDIHFEPYNNLVIVRLRIDGILKISNILTKEEYQAIVSKVKVNSNLDITEKRKPQDGKSIFKFKGIEYDLRISIIPIAYGEKIVVRIMYSDIFNYSLDKLELTKYQREKLNKIIKVSSGMVIITGPTGSGKSTTLYTILNELNTNDLNINTIEDPIEVIIKGINQMSLNRKINMGFAEGVRSLLRQDPDILMIGEIRDEETANISVRACLTGHKVYTTIHTKEPREVYIRLEEMGVKNYWIRDTIVGVISQRLIRTLCNNCKKYHRTILYLENEIPIYKKCGCQKCNNTGYSGRGLIAAIHYIDHEMKSLVSNINENKNILTNIEMVENLNAFLINGMITLEDYINFIEMEEIDFCYEEEFSK